MDEDRTKPPGAGDLRVLLHRLNNQLGIILAHAELIEAKASNDRERTRAAEIVSATLEAMTVTRSIREHVTDDPPA
jgi:hypothetical protein